MKTIPNDATKGKPPYKGAVGVSDGQGHVYATIGNNTQGFFKYYVDGDSWVRRADVPLGPSGKGVKGGTDMAFVPGLDPAQDVIFLMKGYKDEFWRYKPLGDSWTQIASPPVGLSPKYKYGSWLVYDGTGRLWAHKAVYHDFYFYDIALKTWAPITPGMPLLCSQTGKSKKSKAGGCGVYYDGAIYALKGGNTQDFYKYLPLSNTWVELDTMPQLGTGIRKKRSKDGDITTLAGIMYALKGNKTTEFWQYSDTLPNTVFFAPRAGREGVMAERVAGMRYGMTVTPNPLVTGFATVRYSLPHAGVITLRVVDVTGRALLEQTLAASRYGTADLNLRSLSNGVYLVKISCDDFTTSHKLVVER